MPLGALLDRIEGGGTPPRSDARYWNGDIPWASVKDFKNRIVHFTQETISTLGLSSSSARLVPAGTVVLCTRMNVGATFTAGVPLAINQDLKALFPGPDLTSEYLLYVLERSRRQLQERATGTTVKGLRLEALRALVVDLPPVAEQRKIASILSSVDDLIDATRAVIRQVEIVRRESIRGVLSRGNQNPKTAEDHGAPIPPVGWTTAKIGDLADFSGGNGFRPHDWSSSGLPIIRIQNLNGSQDFNFFAGIPERGWLVEPGELLFAWAGTKGSSFGPCLWPGPRGVLNQHIYRMKPRALVEKAFLYLLLLNLTEQVERRAHGFKATLVHLRKSELTGWPVLLPPLRQQREIVAMVKSLDATLGSERRLLDAQLTLKETLGEALLTGRTNVSGVRSGQAA